MTSCVFRKRNLQFDLMDGILYYALVSSLFPLCDLQLNSHQNEMTLAAPFDKFKDIFVQSTLDIFECSYVSVTVFFLCCGHVRVDR